MKCLVGGSRAGVIGRSFHRRKRGVDPAAIRLGRTVGRQRGGCRLDDGSDFLDRQQQIPIRLSLSHQPAQDIAIEQTPLVTGQDMRAMARAHADKAFCGERLDDFAHHATPDTETSFEIWFGWQRRADRNAVLRDLAAKRRKHGGDATGLDRLVYGVQPRPGHAISSRPACLRR